MFRVVGGAVVYGLALYGAAKLLEGPALGCAMHSGVSRKKQKLAALSDKEGDDAPPGAQELASSIPPIYI